MGALKKPPVLRTYAERRLVNGGFFLQRPLTPGVQSWIPGRRSVERIKSLPLALGLKPLKAQSKAKGAGAPEKATDRCSDERA